MIKLNLNFARKLIDELAVVVEHAHFYLGTICKHELEEVRAVPNPVIC